MLHRTFYLSVALTIFSLLVHVNAGPTGSVAQEIPSSSCKEYLENTEPIAPTNCRSGSDIVITGYVTSGGLIWFGTHPKRFDIKIMMVDPEWEIFVHRDVKISDQAASWNISKFRPTFQSGKEYYYALVDQSKDQKILATIEIPISGSISQFHITWSTLFTLQFVLFSFHLLVNL